MVVSLSGMAQQSLSLSKAITIGLEKNFDIQIIKQNQKAAALNNNWGTAGRYPNFNFILNGSINKSFTEGIDVSAYGASSAVEMNWVLFNGFSVKIAKRTLETNEALAMGNTALVIENTVGDIMQAWYLALLEQEKLAINKELVQLSEDRYNRAKTASELGSSTAYDLLQAQNAWLEDKSAMLSQEVIFRNTMRNLNYLMGETENQSWQLEGSLPEKMPDYSLVDLQTKMMSNNTTLKNQFINQKLASLQTENAKSAYAPSLSLNAGTSASWSKTDPDLSGQGVNRSAQPYANLSLSYNLFNGGNRKRAVQLAEISEEVSKLSTEDLKRSMTNLLLQHFDNYNVRQELVSLAGEQEAAARLNLTLSKEKFELGAINSFNYRDIQLVFQNAAINRLNARYNQQLSNIELLTLTGGILSTIEQ